MLMIILLYPRGNPHQSQAHAPLTPAASERLEASCAAAAAFSRVASDAAAAAPSVRSAACSGGVGLSGRGG